MDGSLVNEVVFVVCLWLLLVLLLLRVVAYGDGVVVRSWHLGCRW